MVDLRLVLLAGVLTFAAACSPDPEGADADPAASPETSTGAAETQAAALAAFGLAEQGRVSWEALEDSNGVLRFTGFTLTDAEGVLTAETMSFERPRLTDEGPVFDALVMDQGEITYPDGMARFDQLVVRDAGPGVAEAVAAFFQGREAVIDEDDRAAQRFGEISITALHVGGVSETEAPLSLTLEALSAVGYDGETLDRFSLRNLALDTQTDEGEDLVLRLEQVEIDAFAALMVDMLSERPFNGAINIGEAYEQFRVAGFVMSAGGIAFDMPEMTGVTEDRGAGVVAAVVSMPRLTLSADPAAGKSGSDLANGFAQLGYERFDLSLASTTVYDPEEDRVRTEGENTLILEDGFTLRFEQDVSGVAAYARAYADWLATEPEDASSPPDDVMSTLLLNRFVVSIEDQSLLERAFTAMAAEQGVDPAAMRMQATALIALGGAFAGDFADAALVRDVQMALVGFVGSGGTLVIELEPAEPISAADLASNGVRQNGSGVVVRHQPPAAADDDKK
jgi:hypothetical protein